MSSSPEKADREPHPKGLRHKALDKLRQRIRILEGAARQKSADDTQPVETRAGNDPDAFPPLTPGVLHEVWADGLRDAGAALGFSLLGAQTFLSPARPVIICFQLAWQTQETGLPYGWGLPRLGIDPQSLVIGRLQTLPDLLWCIEEAAACQSVAAIIADTVGTNKLLDFTLSRRLNMRAEAAGTGIFLNRYGTAREASAAAFRWRVSPAPSQAPPFDARAPGPAAFAVEMEKQRRFMSTGPQSKAPQTRWIVNWTENGLTRANKSNADVRATRPAVHGTVSAALGDRLSETG